MSRRAALLLFAACRLWGQVGDLAVVVNTDSGVVSVTPEEARNLFLGRQKYLSAQLMALPVEQVVPEATREQFYARLVRMPVAQVRAYWARLYFTGKAQPPLQTSSAEETLGIVAANRGAVGFVEKDKLDRRVRVVLVLSGKGPG